MLLELAVGDAYGAGFEYADEMIAKHNSLARYVKHPRHHIAPETMAWQGWFKGLDKRACCDHRCAGQHKHEQPAQSLHPVLRRRGYRCHDRPGRRLLL